MLKWFAACIATLVAILVMSNPSYFYGRSLATLPVKDFIHRSWASASGVVGELIRGFRDPSLAISSPPSLSARIMKQHPRLLVNRDSLEKLREKLSRPIYRADVEAIRQSENPADQAFVYLLWGDRDALSIAKSALLEGRIPTWKGLEKSIGTFQAALMYDWLYPALTPSERAVARDVVKRGIPDLSSGYPGRTKSLPYYWNDMWGRGPAATTVAALSLYGDDEWAAKVIESAYGDSHRYFAPYHGGAVDVLNTLALSSGGVAQAGTDSAPGTGYERMFLVGASLFLNSWQSATDEALLEKTTFFNRYPYYLAYFWEGVSEPDEGAKQLLEIITGMDAGDASELAAWFLKKYGRAQFALCLRLILGDLTAVEASSPGQLKLPLATYLEGSDLVVSRTGWDENALVVFMFARHWDSSRFEPESGALGIYKQGKPILVRGDVAKSKYSYANSSAMWIWSDDDLEDTLGQGSTYWGGLNNISGSSKRALNALHVVDPTKGYFRPETLTAFSNAEGEVRATTRYEKLLKLQGVTKAERTVVHRGDTIQILDDIEAPIGSRVVWSLRLAEEPRINGNIVETSGMTVTLLDPPQSRVYWSGGLGRELIGPQGMWHGDKRGGFVEGYSESQAKSDQYGIGYVFAEPVYMSGKYRFKALIEIR